MRGFIKRENSEPTGSRRSHKRREYRAGWTPALPDWYYLVMDDEVKKSKETGSQPKRVSDFIWGAAIVVWMGIVYLLFFAHLIKNFLSTHGG
jgi:hypothetical protein